MSRRSAVSAGIATLAGALAASLTSAAPFTPGNLVVSRVGDGTGSLTSAATPVFLDEFTPGGALVQSIPLPTALSGANRRLTLSGVATSEGHVTRSINGVYLTLTGYDANVGTAAIAGTTSVVVNRVIARINSSGIIDTTTALTDAYNTGNPRSAVSIDGSSFWIGGTGGANPSPGVHYATLGATTSTQLSTTLTNTRNVNIFNGQLYVSSASGAFQGVSSVGAGLPTTSGQTITLLPGFPTAAGPSNYDYVLANPNTLYVADDRALPNGGLQKWVFTGSNWMLQYTLNLGLNAGVRGVTIAPGNPLNPTLYAITAETPTNRLVVVTDTGPSSTFNPLASSPTNTFFRGVDFAPGCAAPPFPGNFTGTPNQLGCGAATAGSTICSSPTPPGMTDGAGELGAGTQYGASPFNEVGNEVGYRINHAGGDLLVDLTGLSSDLDLFLMDSSGIPSSGTLARSEFGGTTPEHVQLLGAAPGTYYVAVDTFGSSNNGSNYNVTHTVSVPPDRWSTWTTDQPDLTYQDIALPAGFFGPGSNPFAGRIQYAGSPLNTNTLGDTDTLVRRTADPVAPADPPSTMGTVPIEIISLSLVSSSPIVVTIAGQPTEWNVQVQLSTVPAPLGTLTATKTHLNGGTFDSTLFVQPLLTFTRVASDCTCGDLDASGNAVNLNDYRHFAGCMGGTGPGGGCDPATFSCADLNQDGGINLRDYSGLQNLFGGVSTSSPPFCAGGGGGVPQTVVLDTGQQGMPPIQFHRVGVPFVHNVNPNLDVALDPCARFIPGIVETIPGNPASQMVQVVTQPSPQVQHTVCVPVPKKVCPPGDDYFATAPCDSGATTMTSFADNPIPAGFFAPGSAPFAGSIALVGVPLDPMTLGDADTKLTRLDALCFPTVPSTSTSPLIISALSLASASPITVVVGGAPELWDVHVGLSDVPPAEMGQIIVRKTHRNGGTFESNFFVQPKFTFTKVSDPSMVLVLDTGLAGLPAIELGSTDPFAPPSACDSPWPWVQSLTGGPPPFGSSCFIPGVREDPMMPAMQVCTDPLCHVGQCFGAACTNSHCGKPPGDVCSP